MSTTAPTPPTGSAADVPTIERDVVIIGAGPAGLMAARTLRASGRSVAVLEARGRVGGRTWNGRVTDNSGREHFIEIGGQWISPDQDRLIELVDELGLETFSRYREGASVYVAPDGTRHTYTGDRLPVAPRTLEEMDRLIGLLDELAAEIGATEPWAAERAAELDSISFRSWLSKHSDDPEAIDNVSIYVASGMLTKPSYAFSTLQAVLMAASAGSFSNLVDEDFILDKRVVGGMQSVSLRLAEEIGEDLYLSSPVRQLDWAKPDPSTADVLNGVAADVRDGVPENGAEGEVVAHSDRVIVRAKNAVLAVPPNLYSRIQFTPPMPREQHIAHQHLSMGLVIKIHAVYQTPFWREEGLSGTGFGGGRLVQEVYDNTNYGPNLAGGEPGTEDPYGTLVGFISDVHAERMWALPADERQRQILQAVADYLGPKALEPIAFYLSDMAAEEWTRGAYAASYDLGGLHRWGHLQNRPTGPIHYACSDIAAEGYQHVDGAIRMGEAAARQILSHSSRPALAGTTR
ncbi:NAD(P)/FAD-dependent oxidoreductase [Cellulosimicrobium funkei]|nr:NAD(P)/FAD-dependent oxidoreductase [Cellulosimicrobium funkei]